VPAAPPARAPTPAPAQPAPQAATTTAPPAQTTQAPTTPQEGRLLNPLQVPAGSGGPAADVVRHGAAAYRSVALPAGGLLTAGLGATLGAGSPGAGLVPGAPTPAAGSSAAGPAAPGGSPPGAPTGSTAGATGAAPTTATTAGGPAAPNAAATTANPAGAAPSTASSGAASTGAPPAPAAPGATASTATPAAGPPSSLPGAAPSAAGAATTASQPAATGAPTGDAAGGPPAPAPAPMSLHVRVLALHPPGQAMSLPGSHGDVLVGTVTGSGNGQVTIATDAGVLTVRTAPPPVGTRVVMQVIAEPGTVMPTTPADQRAQVIQSLSHGWPSLEAAVQALKQINPQMAAQTVQNALPQPGPLLSAGIALFLNALTGGNIGEWLGRSPLAALERGGRGDVARKLTDDFSQMSRLAADPATGDWRVVLLPVYAHDRVHQLRLYMRRHGGNDADDDASGTRFVVEAELSRLGPLQLDGLWRQQRFDLIVRTREALPPEVERGIQDIFLQAGAEANFAGGLGFQVADPFPVAPLDEEDGHAVGVFA